MKVKQMIPVPDHILATSKQLQIPTHMEKPNADRTTQGDNFMAIFEAISQDSIVSHCLLLYDEM